MAVQNQLAARAGKEGSSLSAYLAKDAVKNQINQIVGGKDGPRFISSLVSAVQTNPDLQECSKPSLLSAALLGHSLNLSPSPQLGQYYMVPFKNKKKGTVEATFVLGYKGLIQLAIRSGYYKKLNAMPIKEGELIRYDPLEEDVEVRLIEDEEERENAPTAGYFAMFEYSNGFKKTLYWSKRKMISHADRYSQAFSAEATQGRYPKVSFADYEAGKVPPGDEWLYSSFWYKDFDGMAIKTMLRQIISKWGIMSIDMQDAIAKDEAVIREDLTPEYAEEAEPAAPMLEAKQQEAVPERGREPEQKPVTSQAAVREPEPERPAPAMAPAKGEAGEAAVDPQQSFKDLEDEFFG